MRTTAFRTAFTPLGKLELFAEPSKNRTQAHRQQRKRKRRVGISYTTVILLYENELSRWNTNAGFARNPTTCFSSQFL